jgi:hypothetical protein
MNKPFQDLKITGLVDARCYVIADPIVRIYLQLSNTPPVGWPYTFTMVWRTVLYPAKRPVGFEGDTLWIECAVPELIPQHLAEIESAIAQTNEYFRSSSQDEGLTQQQQKDANRNIQEQLHELGNILNPRVHAPPPKAKPALGVFMKFFCRLLGVVPRKG